MPRLPLALVLTLLATLLTVPNIVRPIPWSPDALFYEAQKLEVEGRDARDARREVFFASEVARSIKARDRARAPGERRISDPVWVEYSSRIYRRRWTVPIAAAALDPFTGQRSLQLVSMLGYVAFAPLIFLLCRRRFPPWLSGLVTLLCLLLPPLRDQSARPLTDTWGLALLVCALLCATLVLDRSVRWLVPWALSLLASSFTRDVAVVVVLGAGWVALRERSAAAIALAGTGLLALIPAAVVGGVPLSETLAYVLNGFRVPSDTSWAFIAHRYPSAIANLIRTDLLYPREFSFPPLVALVALGGLVAVAGTVALFRLPAKGDCYVILHRAAMVAGVATVLVTVNYTQWRLELVLLPMSAIGVARGVEWLHRRFRAVPEQVINLVR